MASKDHLDEDQYRNPHALGGFGLPLPLEALDHLLSFLLLHPTGWDRNRHFGFCGHAATPLHDDCGCCCSHSRGLAVNGCVACYSAWVLASLCKNMLHAVQNHNSPCHCRGCPKSWMDRGWVCPHNLWHIMPSSWNLVNTKACHVRANGMELCCDQAQRTGMGPWHRTDSWDSFSRMRSILFRERAELHRTDREILHRRRPEDPETSSPDPKRRHMDIETSDTDPETSDTDPETSDTDPEARTVLVYIL